VENAANITGASRGGSRRGREAARFYPVTKEPAAPPVAAPEDSSSNLMVRKRKTRHSTNPPVEQHVGWIMDKKAHAHRERLESLSESVGSVASSGGGTPQSLPTFHHPSHSLLKVSIADPGSGAFLPPDPGCFYPGSGAFYPPDPGWSNGRIRNPE
jgi:hypothetical protein